MFSEKIYGLLGSDVKSRIDLRVAGSDIDDFDEFMDKVRVGSDPELFIVDTKTGNVVSSIGLIPGRKGSAWVDPAWVPGYGLETDNILAEFNIPPAQSCVEFVNSMEFMKKYIDRYVKSKNPDLGIMHKASAYVPEDQLQSDEAKLFGCSVDYNVYLDGPNPKPCGETTNLRSTGVHIHVSYPRKSQNRSLNLIRYMDAYVGIPSIILDSGDDAAKRRTLYGKAGCFRLTRYGFEYRSLSGKFIASKDLEEFCYEATINALAAWFLDMSLPPADMVQKCINNSDKELAVKLVNAFQLV